MAKRLRKERQYYRDLSCLRFMVTRGGHFRWFMLMLVSYESHIKDLGYLPSSSSLSTPWSEHQVYHSINCMTSFWYLTQIRALSQFWCTLRTIHINLLATVLIFLQIQNVFFYNHDGSFNNYGYNRPRTWLSPSTRECYHETEALSITRIISIIKQRNLSN